MSAGLAFAEYGEQIGRASTALRANAGTTPLDTPVPTCPDWTVRDLVVHQGTVYHWASDVLDGVPGARARPAADAAGAQGRASADLLGWFDDALVRVLNTLATTPADFDGFFFLTGAPNKRLAWARRQAHETAIHAVDAMAAKLGGVPSATQTWLDREFAADGIDELLTGFAPRSRQRLRSDAPLRVGVECTDIDASWTLAIGPDPVVTTPGRTGQRVDATVRGTAVGLYLALWNRGTDATCEGADALDLWHRTMKISF